MRRPTRISVYAGTFDSQPAVFAHLIAALPGILADEVEVICNQDPRARLAHAFAPDVARAIEDALGLNTTVVLIFPEALAGCGRLPAQTGALVSVGTFDGVRHVAD